MGFVLGDICVVEGQTLNINIGIGPLSLTLMFAPQNGKLEFIGGTLGWGMFFPSQFGFSVTHSYTKTY